MKALSIRQPWAWLIVNGHKDIENRNWKYPPKYRGQLLIHASKTFDNEGFMWVREFFPAIFDELCDNTISGPFLHYFQRGGFVGMSNMDDVVEQSDSPWFFGPLGFVLSKQKPIEFIPYKGQLGLFDVPAEIIKKIKTTE